MIEKNPKPDTRARRWAPPTLVFDIETTGLSADKHKVTVVCTEDFVTGARRAFEFARYPENWATLRDELVAAFDAARSLSAFNGIRFDIPFLVKALHIEPARGAQWVTKTSDILEQSRLRFKTTFPLNLLCQANGIPMKISDGREAIRMAERGDWDTLNEYCAMDVSILCSLYRKRHIVHPRCQSAIDLAAWTRDGLFDEQPAFHAFAREVLGWDADRCAAASAALRHRRERPGGMDIRDLQDRRFDPATQAFVFEHNELSKGWGEFALLAPGAIAFEYGRHFTK
jgi:hypothetical protein